MFNERRQPSRGGTSRMTRECQVRFCELSVRGRTLRADDFRRLIFALLFFKFDGG